MRIANGLRLAAPLPGEVSRGDVVNLSVRPEKIAIDEEVDDEMISLDGTDRVARLPRRHDADHGLAR